MDTPARRRLAEERKRRGWSQQVLAEYLGTTQHNVSRWEAGRTTPSPYFRAKLDELFGMSIQELLLSERTASQMGVCNDKGIMQSFLRFKNNARQAALTGSWNGTAHQEGGLDIHVTFQLQPVGRTIRGEGQIHAAPQNGNMTQSVTVCGEFVYDRFLKLEYTLGEPLGAIQFGYILLEFTVDGQALHGNFLGYGALVTQGIIMGTVHLQRQRAPEQSA